MNNAKLLGMTHKRMGYSVHYSPYRNKDQVKHSQWLDGYHYESEFKSRWLK